MRDLYAIITTNDPLQLGFEFALWTRAMVRELIRDRFGVRLSDVSIGRLLRKLGLSPQRPQRPLRRAYQRDEAKVAAWRKRAYLEIQKLAKQEGATIYFGDKASIRLAVSMAWESGHQAPFCRFRLSPI